jgi:hypothetical protein
MTDEIAKGSIRVLLNEAVSMTAGQRLPITELRGIALYDQQRDARFTNLASFSPAAPAILTIPNFETRYGNEEVNRILLQLIYEYFRRIEDIRFDEAVFDVLWRDFSAELKETHWVYRGVANLRHFRRENSPLEPLNLGDGITIRGRNQTDLTSLGFDERVWDRITEDWHTPFGSSSYVLIAEYRAAKEPANLIRMDSFSPVIKALRSIQTLRLCGPGWVGMSPMWMTRAARFNVGIGGLGQSGFLTPTMGTDYLWTDSLKDQYSTIYGQLVQLEKDGYGKAPGNLGVALRVFNRLPAEQDSQLLDAITTLEALFGIDIELSFRLAFRVAALLATSDKERGELFDLMKGFYDTRSRIVHGGNLSSKHQQYLGKIEELRSLVRRLLRSFIAFAINPPAGYGKRFFAERLDAALLDAAEREKIREALGLR